MRIDATTSPPEIPSLPAGSAIRAVEELRHMTGLAYSLDLLRVFPDEFAKQGPVYMRDAKAAIDSIEETVKRARFLEVFRILFPKQFKKSGAQPSDPQEKLEDAVRTFARLVEQYYFPLPDLFMDAWYEYEAFPDEVQISPIFWRDTDGEEDPHDLEFVFRFIHVAANLIEPDDFDCDPDCSLRAIARACGRNRGTIDTVKLAHLTRREKTPLRHLALACDVHDKATGNIWIDFHDEYYSSSGFDWSVSNVQKLAKEYKRALILMEKIAKLNTWLERSPRNLKRAADLWAKAVELERRRKRKKQPQTLAEILGAQDDGEAPILIRV